MLSQSNPTLIAMQTKEGSRGNVNNVIHRPIPIRMQSNSNNLNTNSQVNSKLYVPTDPSQTIKNTIKEQLKPHIRNFLGSEIFNQGHSITGINALMTIRTDTCTTTHSAAVQCYLSKELAERKLSAEVGFDELNHLTNTLFQKCNGQLQNCVNAEFEFNLLFKISEFPKLHFINELINKDLNTLISSLGRSILHYVKNDLAKLQLTYPAIIHFVFPIACVLPPDYSPHKKILRKNTTYKYELNIRSSEQLKELMSQKQINKLLLDDSQFLLKFRQTITTLLNKVDANLSECSLMKGYEPISKTIKTSYSPLPSTSENVQKQNNCAPINSSATIQSSSSSNAGLGIQPNLFHISANRYQTSIQQLPLQCNNLLQPTDNSVSTLGNQNLALVPIYQPPPFFWRPQPIHNNSLLILPHSQQLPTQGLSPLLPNQQSQSAPQPVYRGTSAFSLFRSNNKRNSSHIENSTDAAKRSRPK